MFGSGNPALNENTFHLDESYYTGKANAMTVQGAVYKTMILLALCVGAASFTWGLTMQAIAGSGAGGAGGTEAWGSLPLWQNPMVWMIGGAIGGLIVALITIFKKTLSPYTAPIYAVLEGLFLGAISAFYEASFGGGGLTGIVAQAVGLTLGVTASMLILYTFRIIKVTAKLRAGIMMATGGVLLFYLTTFVLSLFGVNMTAVHGATPLSIGISLVIVAIAAFNLLIDFDLIERGAEQGAPKYMEWYGAFGLMVTLIWLYLELLRLLAKLQSRD